MRIELVRERLNVDALKGTVFHDVITNSFVGDILASGGYIAGGFVRRVIRFQNGIDASAAAEEGVSPGFDVDVFFTDETTADAIAVRLDSLVRTNKFYDKSIRGVGRSHLGLGFDVCITLRARPENNIWPANSLINVQALTDRRISGCVDDVLSTFDFTNCCAAIVKLPDGSLEIVQARDLAQLEIDRKLDVRPSLSSPLFGKRLIKYLSFGYDELTYTSFANIGEWFYGHAYDYVRRNIVDLPFNERLTATQFMHLFNDGRVSKALTRDVLSSMIGKYTITNMSSATMYLDWIRGDSKSSDDRYAKQVEFDPILEILK